MDASNARLCASSASGSLDARPRRALRSLGVADPPGPRPSASRLEQHALYKADDEGPSLGLLVRARGTAVAVLVEGAVLGGDRLQVLVLLHPLQQDAFACPPTP